MYVLFAWTNEPNGGAEDFAGVFMTLEKARAAFRGAGGHIAAFDGQRMIVACSYVHRTDGKTQFIGWDDDPAYPWK